MEIQSKIDKIHGIRKYPKLNRQSEIKRLLSPQNSSINYLNMNINFSKKRELSLNSNRNLSNNYSPDNTFNRIFNHGDFNNISIRKKYLYKPQKYKKLVKDHIKDLFIAQEKYNIKDYHITDKPTNRSYKEICIITKKNYFQRLLSEIN